jgi:TctA family transporter
VILGDSRIDPIPNARTGEELGVDLAPIAVGLILGEMVETNLQNTLKMFEGQWWLIFTQPLAVLFLVLAFLGLCGPFIYERLFGKRGDVGEPEGAAR